MAEYIIQENVGLAAPTRRVMTDEEVISQLAHHIVFSASALEIPADGTPVIIRLQLSSLPLSDDTRAPIRESIPVKVIADGEPMPLQLDANGYSEFECAFAAAGDYHFTTDGVVYSDGLTIKAV